MSFDLSAGLRMERSCWQLFHFQLGRKWQKGRTYQSLTVSQRNIVRDTGGYHPFMEECVRSLRYCNFAVGVALLSLLYVYEINTTNQFPVLVLGTGPSILMARNHKEPTCGKRSSCI